VGPVVIAVCVFHQWKIIGSGGVYKGIRTRA